MRQISTIRPPIGSDAQTDSDPKRAAFVWLRMTEMFGKRWTDMHGTVPPLTWVRVVDALTNEQIREGLTRIMESGVKHPPGLPEFVAHCKRVEPKPEFAAYHAALPLSPPETDEHKAARLARGREQMQAVKAALRGKA